MSRIFLFVVFILLILPGFQAPGQLPVHAHYTMHDGLPSNKIYSIEQAEDGYIWLSTNKGVVRFDGARFRNFTVSDGLPTNDVFGTYTDAAGKTWLLDFSKGFDYLRNDTLHTCYDAGSGSYEKRIMPGYEDGKIYFVNPIVEDHGRYYIYQDTIRRNMFYDSLAGIVEERNILYCDPQLALVADAGAIMLMTRNGTYILKVGQEMVGRARVYLRKRAPFIFCNKIFLQTGSRNFLYIDRHSRKADSLILSAMNTAEISGISVAPSSLSVTTDKGLVVLGADLRVTDSLYLKFIFDKSDGSRTIKDRSGNIWITTRNDGIYFLPAFCRNIRRLQLPVITGTVLKCAHVPGRTYFLNHSGDLFIFTGDKYQRTIRLPDVLHPGLPPENINLLPDIHGGLYISSIKGMFYLDPAGKLINMDPLRAPTHHGWSGGVKDAFYDAADDRYYFSLFSQLFSFSPVYGVDTGMLRGRYNHIVIPGKNSLWLANDNGITQWHKTVVGGKVSLTENGRIDGLQVSDMISDHKGNVILQIDGRGILVYGKEQAPYSIPEKEVQCIRLDGGGLWVTSGKGARFLTMEHGRYITRRYFANIGKLLYEEVYDLFSDSAYLTLMTDNGMLQIPLDAINYSDSLFTRKPVVTIGFAQGHHMPVNDVFGKYWEKTDVSFTISTFNASYVGDVCYQYYMEGLDHSLHTTSQPVISYPVLPPGKYLFHIRAKVNDLDIQSEERMITIIIRPRWWQSLWFRVVSVLVAAGIIFRFFAGRIKRSRARMQYQSSLENKAAQMELLALQSQMNPHFIFNALGAVKSYFRLNRAAEAEQLLEDFARLIRMYLEFSRHQLIPLQQEIQALETYAAIEQRRFEHKFSVHFIIRIHNEPVAGWHIPPMILQPFVENAINHGLFRRQGQGGKLRVFFLDTKDALVVAVDDNGVGRKRAMEINSRLYKLFPSRGSGLVADRIQVLNESGIAAITHEITDRYDRDNHATGTRVVVRFFKNQT